MPNPKYRVTAENLNFRKAPSITSEVIKCIKKGQIIESIEMSDDHYWIKSNVDGQEGWMSHKYLELVTQSVFPWFPIAMAEIGVKEIPGVNANPRIVMYLKSTSLKPDDASKDETAWCSAFVNWCVEKSGYEGTDSAWARSWLNWGSVIDNDKPITGCVAIFERDERLGHVGFFIADNGSTVTILGGNQGNGVCIKDYDKKHLLGYRAI